MNFAVLAVAWHVRFGGLGERGVLGQLAKVLAASAALGAAAWATHQALRPVMAGGGLGGQALRALVPIAAGGLAYAAAARLLRVGELGELTAAVRRRAARRRAG
jgi:hypothetical protein